MIPRTTGAAALLLLAAALAVSAQTPTPPPVYVTPHPPLLGSAWYPEQWPESRWDADLTLMEHAHFNVVRLGEFAWSRMEPSEGHFDLDWLDRAIALAGRHHIQVVLGTPTDAPPAWLTARYPQTLRIDAAGHPAEHGGRRQFNYADPTYRRFCAQIARQLALRFGHTPDVIGWQIGNEYTDESFDPATRAQFQHFLQQRYGTLANLNRRWTTAYWSQTYTDWSQIPLATTGNPGLLLEHKHFVTATWLAFQQNQIDALRPLIAPAQFITTNIGGLAWSDNWDHYAITSALNLASWDDYVGQGHLNAPRNAMLNDFVRGWKRANFWVMETEPASVNWAPINNALAPGETRALAWQTVAHGADAVLYWQWRSALNGQEQYHGAIVGPDGNPLPLYPELTQLGQEFAAAAPALAHTAPRARVALLHSYDSRWAIDFQPHTTLYDQQAVLLDFYQPLRQAGTVDIIDPTQDTTQDPTRAPLARYSLLVAPSLNVVDDALAQKLLAWVRAGGHLLLGPRSGMKDQFNALNPQRQPGPLASALGAKVEQYYALDHPVGLIPASLTATSLTPAASQPADPTQTALPAHPTASIWAEALTPATPNARIDLRYSDPGGWLDNQPAMITRTLGRGSISYLGTLPDPDTLRALTASAIRSANLPLAPTLPPGVELCLRQPTAPGAHPVAIVLNHSTTPADILLPGTFQTLPNAPTLTPTLNPATLPTHAHATHFTLPPQGIALLFPNPPPTHPQPPTPNPSP